MTPQPVDDALIRTRRAAHEAVVTAIDALDVELLAGFDLVLLPQLHGQDNLALGRDAGLHGGKISSYARGDQGMWGARTSIARVLELGDVDAHDVAALR